MRRWLTTLILLGSAVSACGSGGAAAWKQEARIQNFWQLLGKTPDSAEVVREAALRAARLGDAALCRRLFLEGALQFPDEAALLYFEMGGAMSRLGREDAALAAFRRAVVTRTGMRVSFAYFALATLHERRGDVEEAWAVFEELLADEDALSIHLVEAAAFALRHGMGDPERLFEGAVGKAVKEGSNMEARVVRRWAGLKSGEEALALYEKLHGGSETEATDFQRAGLLAAGLGQDKRWESFFREGMQRHPESRGWLQYELAVQMEVAGRVEEALELYRAAKKDPSGLKAGFAYVGLGKLLETCGKPEEASRAFAELLMSKDALPPHLAEAGGFEARQGRVERGLELYLEAFQRARDEEDQIAVGNILSEGMAPLPGLKELANWFRTRTGPLPELERTRVRRSLATTFGNHSWKLLNQGDFATAEASAEMARVIYAPDLLKWVEGNRAHACLFQGRVQEAWKIHQCYQGEQLELEGFDWKKAVKEDFRTFRENGLVKPAVEAEMRKLEGMLGIGTNKPEAGTPGPETTSDRGKQEAGRGT